MTARKLGLGSDPLPDRNDGALAAASHAIASPMIASHLIAWPGRAWMLLASLFLIGSFIVLGTGTPFLPVLDYAVQLSRVAGVPAFALCATARVLRLGKGLSADDLLGREICIGLAVVFSSWTLAVFGVFKQTILPTRSFVWDERLAWFDSILAGGPQPWTYTHAIFGGVRGTLFLDGLYVLWLPLMFGFPLFASLLAPSHVVRVRLLGSWLFAWLIIGVGAAWMFSSAGPCFYNELVGPNQSFAELNARLTLLAAEATAQGREISAIPFQTTLIDVHKLGRFGPAGGISAMPSMHVAMATLFAIGGFTIGRRLGVVMTLYAVFVWIGSVHLGWHYASDGPVAAVLMLLIWEASGRAATRFIAQAEPSRRFSR